MKKIKRPEDDLIPNWKEKMKEETWNTTAKAEDQKQ